MKNLSLRTKCFLSFGAILALLAVIAFCSTTGIKGIIGNANEVIEGNALRGMLVQNEVDHLNWVAKVNALLTDDSVTQLKVQTDDHKCSLGQWLYSNKRKEAELLIPALTSLFKEIEEPHAHLHASAVEISEVFVQGNTSLPETLAIRAQEHLEWASEVRDTFLENKHTLQVQTDPTQCNLGKWINSDEGQQTYQQGDSNFKATWEQLVISHNKLHQSAETISNSYKQIHEGIQQQLLKRLLDHKDWSEKVAQGLITANADLGVETDPTQCGYGLFLASPEFDKLSKAYPELTTILHSETSKQHHANLHYSAVAISEAIQGGNLNEAKKIYRQETLTALTGVSTALHEAIAAEESLLWQRNQAKKIFDEATVPHLQKTLAGLHTLEKIARDELTGMQQANIIFSGKTKDALHKVQGLLGKIKQTIDTNMMTDDAMVKAAGQTNLVVISMSIIGLMLGAVLAFLVVRAITVPIYMVTSGLGDGAEQVAAASGQVSNSSQSLAEGASEQAASLEETSSSLEELASMTRQNAENANQANKLMKDADSVVIDADNSMKELTESMSAISLASEETSKIIKTIDEIAFQTNLLALNAAVEAARAGEAGAGFAVVADEGRNLAMRAAEAAKDTGVLIEGTVEKVHRGTELVNSADLTFTKVTESVRKVGALVAEISAASSQQDEGISQINRAVSQMDQVTQNNAANAEESASASEEMNAQAQQMMEFVNELIKLVEGANRSGVAGRHHGSRQPVHARKNVAEISPKKMVNQLAVAGKDKVDPQRVIPFDDDDFENF